MSLSELHSAGRNPVGTSPMGALKAVAIPAAPPSTQPIPCQKSNGQLWWWIIHIDQVNSIHHYSHRNNDTTRYGILRFVEMHYLFWKFSGRKLFLGDGKTTRTLPLKQWDSSQTPRTPDVSHGESDHLRSAVQGLKIHEISCNFMKSLGKLHWGSWLKSPEFWIKQSVKNLLNIILLTTVARLIWLPLHLPNTLFNNSQIIHPIT